MAEFTRTFSVAVPVTRAWEAFTDPEERAKWNPADEDVFEVRVGGRVVHQGTMARVEGVVEEVDEGRMVRWSEGPGLLPGPTQLSVTFEEADSGTRITVTQSGFGDGDEWLGDLDAHARGWTHIMADLALYLETGVVAGRAFDWRGRLGIAPYQTSAGVRVAWVVEGGAGEQAGIRPHDVVIRVGSAPIFDITDMWMFVSEHEPGTGVELTYVRDGEVRTGTGTLGG